MSIGLRAALALAAILAAAGAGGEPTGAGDGAAGHAAALDALRERITQMEAELAGRRRELSSASAELSAVDRDLEARTRHLRQIEQSLAARLARLRELEAERAARRLEAGQGREALARQLRAVHRLGRRDRLRLLLTQEDPDRAGRMLVFHQYYSRARAARIESLSARLRELEAVRQAIRLETAKLRRLRAEADRAVAELDSRRAAQLAAVAAIERGIDSRAEALAALRENQARLQALLEQLEAIERAEGAAREPFATLQGRLAWPAAGRVLHGFGTSRGGDLSWQGVMLEVEPGTPVAAVSAGRVVFADEFRPFGRLLIVDHGDGYLTLYGHIESLARAAGDAVESGEVVGTAGRGGRGAGNVYFEIRKDGKPLNPARWCGTPATSG